MTFFSILHLFIPFLICKRHTPYTHLSLIWLCYNFVDISYIPFNFINFITLNISYKFMIAYSTLNNNVTTTSFNFKDIVIHHILKHYAPLPLLYYQYCSLDKKENNVILNIIMSYSWAFFCVGSLDLSHVYQPLSYNNWIVIWMCNTTTFIIVSMFLNAYSICF